MKNTSVEIKYDNFKPKEYEVKINGNLGDNDCQISLVPIEEPLETKYPKMPKNEFPRTVFQVVSLNAHADLKK